MTTTLSASNPIITYSDNWNFNETDGTMVTTIAGSTANVTFDGTSVQVFGTLPVQVQDPASSYSLDGAPPVLFDATRFEGYEVQKFILYQSNLGLARGNHSLVITSLSDGPDFVLDSMVFSSNLTVPSTSFTASSEIPSSSSSSPPLSSGGGGPNVSAIADGIVVGASILVGALAAFLLVRRRRLQRAKHFRTVIQPFLAEYSTVSSLNHAQNNDTLGVGTRLTPSAPSMVMTAHSGPPPSYHTNLVGRT
ncbi:MAG: hypothetical protein NXY57DRAFT_978089 [Lentinula lateritia]|uniref:Uncharacterized protein n=1 Tax=Lentinula lateritia TaxID=40482 RepID=A0ABQ8VN66_9AGAR|nr:MAG: hypothetical protein NXY57DRAFT_978089 [Lentinula lateritia]KAJ4497837.1 hypothetical protein C8R41DRAFT_979502 [Lentinula lateritia]